MNACTLIPIYDHGATLEGVVAALAPTRLPCLVVDDGSGADTQRALERVAAKHDFVEVIRRERNGGKGAALKTGYRAARERGFSHALQLDADGQHRAEDAKLFLDAMRARPDALVLGVPVFDDSAPWVRIAARQLSRGLVWLACLSRTVRDPLCGYRGVPLDAALDVVDSERTGDRMEFEPELAVRLVWRDTPVVSLPTPVVYPPAGVSHFSLRRDYPLLAACYARLVGGMLMRAAGKRRVSAMPQADWTRYAERGTGGAIRAMVWLHRTLGRRFCRLLLWPIAGYFYLRERAWRGASRRHLDAVWSQPGGARSLGRRPGALAPLRHYHEFGAQMYDRMLLWGGGVDQFEMEHAGSEHLFALARAKRGAILLGSHLGSFDMARTLATRYGLALNAVMYTDNGERINRLFEELDPDSRVRVLAFDPTSVKTAFEIRACLERGELVGILADRLPEGSTEEPIWIPFLGRPTPWPRSPFELACLVGCPLLVSVCVRVGDEHYRTTVEPLGEASRLPRRERRKGAEALAREYVRHLERLCIEHPHQWFNFYDPPEAPASA